MGQTDPVLTIDFPKTMKAVKKHGKQTHISTEKHSQFSNHHKKRKNNSASNIQAPVHLDDKNYGHT